MSDKINDKEIYSYKVILLGDSFVGKTSLIIRFCDNIFEESGTATIGIDTKTKYVIRKDKKIELQIWDTAGQERFRSLAKNCTNQMDGIILVYDISNKDSFHNVKIWYKNLKDTVDFEKVGTVLVGNKCDKGINEVDKKIVEAFCKQKNLTLIESSAKNNINVSEIFTSLIDKMMKLNNENQNFKRTRSKIGKVTSSEEEETKKKKNCC